MSLLVVATSHGRSEVFDSDAVCIGISVVAGLAVGKDQALAPRLQVSCPAVTREAKADGCMSRLTLAASLVRPRVSERTEWMLD